MIVRVDSTEFLGLDQSTKSSSVSGWISTALNNAGYYSTYQVKPFTVKPIIFEGVGFTTETKASITQMVNDWAKLSTSNLPPFPVAADTTICKVTKISTNIVVDGIMLIFRIVKNKANIFPW